MTRSKKSARDSGCGQSCHPSTDDDGLFPNERGRHRNLFQIFLGDTIGIETFQTYLSEERVGIVRGDTGRVFGYSEIDPAPGGTNARDTGISAGGVRLLARHFVA